MFDYRKLKGRIIEKFNNMGNFAAAMGLNRTSLSQKMHNKSSWVQSEISKACILLDIPTEQIPGYFFDSIVQDVEQQVD